MQPSPTISTKMSTLWHSPCCNYSKAGLITLIAISCIVLGAIAYSGSGLSAIGTNHGLAMWITGGSLLAVELIVLYFKRHGSVLSYEEKEKYKDTMKLHEYFIYNDTYRDGTLQKRAYVGQGYSCDLDDLDPELTRVSLRELKSRK